MTLLSDFRGVMKKGLTVITLLGVFLSGCVGFALHFSPSLISNLTEALFEECDPEMAKQSLPADLKLMEGLLKSDPSNRRLLTSLCMGFAGYAMLFVEDENPERASQLYLRAKRYGLLAIGDRSSPLKKPGRHTINTVEQLSKLGKEALEPLFWTALSWNAWINLNLDKPAALAQLGIAQALVERALEMNPEYFYGSPYVLMGTILAARPKFLGGDPSEAKKCFEKAMCLSQKKFFLVHYYYAKHYAVRIQDRNLFLRLIREIETAPPDELQDVCLINAVIKQKAKSLVEKSEELFF